MSNLINEKYFKSEAVKVFPASYRTEAYRATAENLTEFNLLRAGGAINYGENKNYIIEYITENNHKILKCVIGGYYFEIDLTIAEVEPATIAEKGEQGGYLCIKINEDKLSSFELGSTNLDIDINSNGISAFTGLKVTDDPTGSNASLRPFNKNDNTLNCALKAPKISAGSSASDNAVALNNDDAIYNKASGAASFAHGKNTEASGEASHAEGEETIASGKNSHAEGYKTKATGKYAHAEGENFGAYINAEGQAAHSEGYHTKAKGNYSHAEGLSTKAIGEGAHAEGLATEANGDGSHAEGSSTVASGNYSHAEGDHTIADKPNQTVVGKYNESTNGQFIIGSGANDENRKNSLVVNGNDTTIRSKLHINKKDKVENETTHELELENYVDITEENSTIESEDLHLKTPTGEHIDIEKDLIKVCLHKDNNGKSKGKLVLDLNPENNNKTRAELNAAEVKIVGDTTVTGDLTAESNNVKLGPDVTDLQKAGLNITNNGDTHKVDINGATTINNTLDVTGNVTAQSNLQVGNNIQIGPKSNYGTISYDAEKKIKLNTNDSEFIFSKPDEESTGIKVKENNTEVELAQKVKNIIFNELFDSFYPIGAIYVSYQQNEDTKNTEGKYGCPIADFGGRWERIQDTFLYAAKLGDEIYDANNTGGSKDAVLVKHKHEVNGGEHTHPITVNNREMYTSFNYRGTSTDNRTPIDYIGKYFDNEGKSHDQQAVIDIKSAKVNDTSWPSNEQDALNKTSMHPHNMVGSLTDYRSWRMKITATHKHTASSAAESYYENNVNMSGHKHNVSEEGVDKENKNMPPYLCVYMWRRLPD